MNWLNDNAAAIQALSGVAVLVVTGLLARLTSRYVRLTRDIANSSLEQVRLLRESMRADLQHNASALHALALGLRTGIGQQLDPETPKHNQLRAFAILTEREITDLQALANRVGGQAITSAGEAAGHLRVIHEMVQTAKGISEAMGWTPKAEDKARWRKAVEGADRSLQEIQVACQRVVESTAAVF